MTQPARQGFPDWQRQSPAQNVIFAQINQAFAGPTNIGPYHCAYAPSTRVSVVATNHHLSILLFWFADKALTQPLGQQELIVQQNNEIDVAVSNMGPWFIAEITAQAYPVTTTFQLSAVAYVGQGLGLGFSNILIATENAAIGIGATLSIFSTFVYPGPAVINVNANQGPFTVSLSGVDITGARVPFFQAALAAKGYINEPTFLPASIVRILVNNASGVAMTASAYVVGNPDTRPSR